MSARVFGAARSSTDDASWEPLRAKAKGLKAQLDSKMMELGKLAGRLDKAREASSSSAAPSSAAPSMAEVERLRNETERCLGEFKDSSEALARLAKSGSQSAQAARFKESHQELMRDFKRVAQNIEQQQQHARLISGRGSRKDASDNAEAGLLRERSALDGTNSMIDDVIGQAQATHERLVAQRGTLGGVGGKIGALSSRFPALESLISNISDKKRREQLILSFTVACCVIFSLWYKFL